MSIDHCKAGPRAKSNRLTLVSTLPASARAIEKQTGHHSRDYSGARRASPRFPVVPLCYERRGELTVTARAGHHGMTIEARERAPRMDLAMPERFVVTFQAGAISFLDRLSAIDAELDQSAHPEPSTEHRVIAPRPVTSFASPALQIAARRDLKQLAHLRFREFEREFQMAGVAIYASDVARLREVSELSTAGNRERFQIAGILRLIGAGERRCCENKRARDRDHGKNDAPKRSPR